MFRKDLRIKTANEQEDLLNQYGNEYEDQDEKVTPFHILFKDYSNDIASMDKEEAVQFVIDKINELNDQFGEYDKYHAPNPQMMDYFYSAIQDQRVKDGMGVIFEIKDFLLENMGLTAEASIKQIFTSPRHTKKVMAILNTLIEADKYVKGRRK